MFSKFSQTSTSSTDAKIAFLKKAANDLRTLGSIMTPWERLTVQEEVKRKQEEFFPDITRAVIGKFDQAAKKYQDTRALVAKARANEINRWDAAKLNEHTERYTNQINQLASRQSNPLGGFNPADAIERVLSEALQSGDVHKIRAAAEVVQSTQVTDSNSKTKMVILQRSAGEALKNLSESEEIRAAQQLRAQTLAELDAVKNEVIETSKLFPGQDATAPMFANGPYANALKRINTKNGEVEILDANDPKVSGIDWSMMPEGWKPE